MIAKVIINGHFPSNNLFLKARQACSTQRAIHFGSEPLGGGWKGTRAQRISGGQEKQGWGQVGWPEGEGHKGQG